VTGSFTPYATPSATLSGTGWGGSSGLVATGCGSASGLHSLPLNTSTGTW
jgi:hypothetical protein